MIADRLDDDELSESAYPEPCVIGFFVRAEGRYHSADACF